MPALAEICLVIALAGGGLVTGLLFAFSNFAMRALDEQSPREAMAVMRAINVRIINPVFFVLFFGTPLAAGVVVVLALRDFDAPGAAWRVVGGAAYLLGPLAITGLRNVPLNDRLAATPLEDAERAWLAYRVPWQRWNHLRTALGAVALIALARGATLA
ncbi:MAG: anthrone oxygenase family protein [Planctomycetota bacterium]